MASSVSQQPAADGGKAKNKKKDKGTKLNIEEFVSTNNFKMVDSSWADIMEDEDVIVAPISLPSAPKSTLGPEVDINSIPHTGPFRLSVANLQYEVTEEQLTDVFGKLQLTSVRLNTEGGRMLGTASVEFVTRGDLIEALELNNRQLNGRALRIYLPDQNRYGDRDGRRGGGRSSYVDNTPSNWRSATRGTTEPSFPNKPEKVFPPPTSGFGSGGGGYGGRSGGGGRYGGGGGGSDDFSRPPRSDFGSGGYGGRRDYGGGEDGGRRGGDDFGRREGGGGRRYGDDSGRSGNQWGRSGPREEGGEGGGGGAPEGNWRRDGPRPEAPPAGGAAEDFPRRDNRSGYGRDDMPPPARDRDAYGGGSRGGGGDSFRRSDRGGDDFERRDRGSFERRERPPQDDLYDAPRARGSGGASSEEYNEQPRSFAPPPRDRAYSGRSDRSQEDGAQSHAPKSQDPDRRPELRAERLKNLLGEPEEETSKPASYNSIFGSAKPVDTAKREMEIEKRLAEERERQAEAKAAAAAAAAAASAENSGSDGATPALGPDGEPLPVSPTPSGGEHRGPRGPRAVGPDGGPPPRMRGRENGERRGGPMGERRDGGERRYGDSNGDRFGGDRRDRGGMGDRRRDGDGRRPMDGDRPMGGRRDGPPGERRGGGMGRRDEMGGGFRSDGGSFGGGDGPRRFGGPRGDDDGRAPRYQHQNERIYRRSQDAPFDAPQQYGDRSRYTSEGDDDKEKIYTTPNKFAAFGDEEEE